MNSKNNIFLPIIVIGVSIAFVIISLLVFFSNGKPSFIKRKLQIGALLLTLTVSISTFGAVACWCYAPPPDEGDTGDSGDSGSDEDIFAINSEHLVNGQIIVNLNDDDTTIVDGTITNITSGKYSYRITEGNVTPIIIGEDIYALDGAFDENIEEFAINFLNTGEGIYTIYFYSYNLQEQTQYYNIIIIK
jgi:hypothetical protein